MEREYFIRNMEGTLYWRDMPLFEFVIRNRELVSYKDLSDGKMWPAEPKTFGMSYRSINEFFRRRVIDDHAMWLTDYLEALGLDHYDFEEIVKRNNGNNHLDDFWVKFDDLGAKTFKDIYEQQYPIYGK